MTTDNKAKGDVMRDALLLNERLYRRTKLNPVTGCIEWFGPNTDGYGRISTGGCILFPRKTCITHRFAWELKYGAIPNGLHVLHRCDNRKCINTEHLFLGTNKDNCADMVKKGRSMLGERNPNAKLTTEKVKEIRHLHKSMTNRELANKFGVSHRTIEHIVGRRRWKTV